MARRRKAREPAVRGSVYPLLDLHGLTAAEARVRAGLWLRARQADGERTVVVVTGRGNRSRGLPVLPGEVEHLLAELEGSVVSAWEAAEGGGGFRVTLLRPAPTPASEPPPPPTLRTADPALVRRAEEALWELGIAPTPALLDAEIRRLLAAERRS